MNKILLQCLWIVLSTSGFGKLSVVASRSKVVTCNNNIYLVHAGGDTHQDKQEAIFFGHWVCKRLSDSNLSCDSKNGINLLSSISTNWTMYKCNSDNKNNRTVESVSRISDSLYVINDENHPYDLIEAFERYYGILIVCLLYSIVVFSLITFPQCRKTIPNMKTAVLKEKYREKSDSNVSNGNEKSSSIDSSDETSKKNCSCHNNDSCFCFSVSGVNWNTICSQTTLSEKSLLNLSFCILVTYKTSVC